MNRKYYYIILLLFTSVSLQAQIHEQHIIDSMLSDLNSDHYSKDDTNKIRQLIRISWKYTDLMNPDEGRKYSEQALILALKINWKKGIFGAYESIGEAYMNKRENAKALEYYTKAMQAGEEMRDKEAVAGSVSNIAKVYYQMGDCKRSLENNFKALKIHEETGDRLNMAREFNSIGKCYIEQSYYPKAIEYLYKALTLYEQLGLKKYTGNSYIDIANVFLYEDDYTKALENFAKALKLYEEIKDDVGIAYCYTSIGSAYQVKGDLDKSLEYYQKALKLPYTNTDKNLAGNLAGNIGNLYFYQHKYMDAIEYFQVSLKILNETGGRNSIANNLSTLGDCFLAIARETPHNKGSKKTITITPEIYKYRPAVDISMGKAALLHAAFDSYQKGLTISREINSQRVMQSCYEGLSETYRQSNNYKKALVYADSARMMKDSLFSKDNREKIVRMSLKNDYDNLHLADSLKHVQDIQAANFQLLKQRWTLYISISMFILVIIAVVILQSNKMAKNKAAQEALFSRQLLEIELKALRAQMNPHFIFNSLNSIQTFILKENKVAATDYLQKFSKLIRMILDNSQKTSNTIEDEAEILTLYMDMEKLRLKDKFDFEIVIPPDLDTTFTEIPSMVLQPLVENSIWHGLMNAPRKGLLKVLFIKEKNKLTCIVEDNGIGRAKSKELHAKNSKTHESKGMKMIKDRLEAWSQTKGLLCTFNISDNINATAGTRTEITILYPPYA